MDLHQWMTSDLVAMRARLFDSVVAMVPPERWHEHVDGGGSSVTHLLLHVARHQDLAVNTVVRGDTPLFAAHRAALGLAQAHDGVGLAEREEADLTALVPAEPLVAYLTETFDTTRDWLDALGSMVLDATPNAPYRLTHLAGLDADHFSWLLGMWREKAIWWFVQWPVLGHGNAHVGEGIGVRNRMGLSPF